MAAQYYSKHGIVSKSREELFMSFTDLSNFGKMVPEGAKADIKADYDTLSATIQGFTIGVKVTERHPYDRIVIEDNGAPFKFSVTLHFDEAEAGKTDFSLEVEADLNLMMKAMLGRKIQDGIDKVVDGLVAVSEGKKPF